MLEVPFFTYENNLIDFFLLGNDKFNNRKNCNMVVFTLTFIKDTKRQKAASQRSIMKNL